jgi:hypothetical protein
MAAFQSQRDAQEDQEHGFRPHASLYGPSGSTLGACLHIVQSDKVIKRGCMLVVVPIAGLPKLCL